MPKRMKPNSTATSTKRQKDQNFLCSKIVNSYFFKKLNHHFQYFHPQPGIRSSDIGLAFITQGNERVFLKVQSLFHEEVALHFELEVPSLGGNIMHLRLAFLQFGRRFS